MTLTYVVQLRFRIAEKELDTEHVLDRDGSCTFSVKFTKKPKLHQAQAPAPLIVSRSFALTSLAVTNQPRVSVSIYHPFSVNIYVRPLTISSNPTSHPPATPINMNFFQRLAYHAARTALWLAGLLYNHVAPALADFAAGQPAQQIQFPAEPHLELGMPNSPVTSEEEED